MKVLLLSDDPVALDTIFCRMIDLDPTLVPTNIYGEAYGVGHCKMSHIQIMTEEGEITKEELVKSYGNPDFDVYRGSSQETQLKMLKPLEKFLKNRPFIVQEKCVKCGICVESCPIGTKALKFPGNKPGKKIPVYNYDHCIRCYCCQEMCPQKAIEVKIPLMTRLLDRKWTL